MSRSLRLTLLEVDRSVVLRLKFLPLALDRSHSVGSQANDYEDQTGDDSAHLIPSLSQFLGVFCNRYAQEHLSHQTDDCGESRKMSHLPEAGREIPI